MPRLPSVLLVLLGIGLAACTARPGPKDIGASADGVTGGPSPGNRVAAAPINPAAASVFLGSRISSALDDDDKRRAYAAQMQALETGPSGAPVAWRNPDSGRYGNVVPGPAYQINGANCRQYTHTVYIDGKPQFDRGTACRNADGTWSALG